METVVLPSSPIVLAREPFPPASDSSQVISMQIMGAVQEYLENGIVQNVELALNFTDCFLRFLKEEN